MREQLLARRVAGVRRVLPAAARIEHDEPLLAHEPPQPVRRRHRPRPVGGAVEEGHRALDLVRVRTAQGLDPVPAEVRGPEQPRVPDPVAVQYADHRARGQQLGRRIVVQRVVRGPGIAARGRKEHRKRSVRGRDQGEVAAEPLDPLPGTAAQAVQDPQGVRGVQRLAERTARSGSRAWP